SLRGAASSQCSAPCVRQVVAKSFEPAAHARVEPHRSGLEDDASDQVRVDLPFGLHLAAGGLLDAAENPAELLLRQLLRRRQLHVQDPLLGGDECVELVRDLRQLRRAPLLREQLDEVDDHLLGARPLRDPREHVLLHPRVDLRVVEEQTQLVGRGDGLPQLADLRLDLLELVLVLRGLEERTRVDAVRDGYVLLPSSRLKSISASASSIKRCWSESVSDLRVIFSAASSESRPTSSRIWPSACTVAWSICRRVSSSRRCRSSSVSSRTRARCASASLRASERISSESA